MSEAEKKCMACAKSAPVLKSGICEACQDKIRREAMGEQARRDESADRELTHHGVKPIKK